MYRQTEEQRAALSRLIAAERGRVIRNPVLGGHWYVFREWMRRIAQDGLVPEHRAGLCYETPTKIYKVVVELQQFWPARSGRRSFPVPAPLDLQNEVRRHYRGYDMRVAELEAAGIAYSEGSEAFRYEGAYGMYRRRLASFLWAAAEEILDGRES